MRILGIDYGDSRIGLALSDPFGWTAQGIDTLSCKNGLENAVKEIVRIVSENKVEKIVIGLPKNMNGTLGPRGEKTQAFAEKIAQRTGIEVVAWDERLTTVAANRTMHEMGTKTSKKKGLVDRIAAVYILQGYLDSIK
ncbi:MAG: Holliday junction resolvase RuvX [Bacillota bacterium]|nr:Holliday junction resolvase RuvX [Bacillota bacterium]